MTIEKPRMDASFREYSQSKGVSHDLSSFAVPGPVSLRQQLFNHTGFIHIGETFVSTIVVPGK